MRMFDIIKHKRDGLELTEEEIAFFVRGYADGSIPDYQASALAMAIYYQGMSARETGWLTTHMACSGDQVDLSRIPGIKVDKHSTGGVGDKTTLAVAPIVASLGVPVAKMSGRGLGHTGGTLDKLESIPGLSVEQPLERFFEIVHEVGVAVVGQTGNLVPADKKLYALRDVTATIDSIPLIASSVMSKKIAAGADRILLDVKCGSGAFMKTPEDAVKLAQAMVAIGEEVGRTTVALISDMDRPLGLAIGNALEVMEAADVLKGCAPDDITQTCLELAANMLVLAEQGSLDECRALARRQVANGEAFERMKLMVGALGGDARVLDDYALFGQAACSKDVAAPRAGYLCHMDTEGIGMASVALGAGRAKKEDAIDMLAGIRLAAKTGDRVEQGAVLATLYAATPELLEEGERRLLASLEFADEPVAERPHFFARVSCAGVEAYD